MIVLFSPKVTYQIAKNIRIILSYTLPCFLAWVGVQILDAPVDIAQGYHYRWIYLHVPAAIASLACAAIMSALSVCAWIYRLHVAYFLAKECAWVGLAATIIALLTGSIWGSVTWGAWWIWDMRMTSELLLAFLYIGFLICDDARTKKLLSPKIQYIIAVLILANIPIIHFSVVWWNSLHQKSTLLALGRQTMPSPMFMPLIYTILSCALLIIWYMSGRLTQEYARRFV
jgi:heme exporter protein C